MLIGGGTYAKLTHGSAEPLPKFGNSLIERQLSRPLMAEYALFSRAEFRFWRFFWLEANRGSPENIDLYGWAKCSRLFLT